MLFVPVGKRHAALCTRLNGADRVIERSTVPECRRISGKERGSLSIIVKLACKRDSHSVSIPLIIHSFIIHPRSLFLPRGGICKGVERGNR